MMCYSQMQVVDEYRRVEIDVYLSWCKERLRQMLQRSGFYEKFNANHVFLTVHDAVLAAVEQDLEAFNEIVIDVLVNEIVLPSDFISSASRNSLANRKISLISLGISFRFCILSNFRHSFYKVVINHIRRD